MSIEELVEKYYASWARQDMTMTQAIRAALTELAVEYEEQLEVERMRLAACGVIAMSNTAESASKARQMRPEYWSASAEDCANAVDREMALQERIRKLSETHAMELRAYEATVANLEQRIRELEAQREPDELRANLIVGCDEITSLCRHLRLGGCDSSDLSGLEEGLSHAIDVAYEMISMLAAAPAPAPVILASRCPMCFYQHGHQIGCENNPVDIALLAAAPKKEGE